MAKIMNQPSHQKIMSDELYNITSKELLHLSVKHCDITSREESFNKIRRWLNEHKEDRGHLEESANYKDIFSRSTLHILLRAHPPLDLVESLMQLAPTTIRIQDKFGDLPLHWACRYKASTDVVKMLLEAYPEAVGMQGEYGMLPLHYACKYGAPSNVVEMLADAFPQGITKLDDKGNLPLDYALAEGELSPETHFLLSPQTFWELCQGEESLVPEISYKIMSRELYDVCSIMSKELLSLCVEAWRKDRNSATFDSIWQWLKENEDNHMLLEVAASKKDDDSRTPIHWLVRARPPCDLVESLIQLAPDAVKVKDKYGETPLHWACRYDASHDVVKILLAAYPLAAELPDRYGNLPLHTEWTYYSPLSHAQKKLPTSYPKAKGYDIDEKLPRYNAYTMGA
jgi:ankyrin repeat protein